MSDETEEQREPIPLEDRHDAALRALAIAMEERQPGVIERALEILTKQIAVDDVILIHGPRTEAAIRDAHASAGRVMAVTALVGAKHAVRVPFKVKREKGKG